MFTSAAAFHPDMLSAIQPIDGEPTRFLQRLARQGNSVICGSFLASCNGDSYNRWTLPDNADADHALREMNLTMLKEAPVRFARMLGIPVVHGSDAEPFCGYWSPDLPDVPYDSKYLGEAFVADTSGNILARRALQEGAGVAAAEITLPPEPTPSETIPAGFWIPEEMPEPWKASWNCWLDTGLHYYRTVTKPFLDTGEVREYVPAFMQ